MFSGLGGTIARARKSSRGDSSIRYSEESKIPCHSSSPDWGALSSFPSFLPPPRFARPICLSSRLSGTIVRDTFGIFLESMNNSCCKTLFLIFLSICSFLPRRVGRRSSLCISRAISRASPKHWHRNYGAFLHVTIRPGSLQFRQSQLRGTRRNCFEAAFKLED